MRPYPYLRMKERKSPKVIISIFIAVIMVVSVIGFGVSYATSSTERRNGFTVKLVGNYAQVKEDGTPYLFSAFPSSYAHMPAVPGLREELAAKQVVTLSYDPNDADADQLAVYQYNIMEVYTTLFPNLYIQQGLAGNNSYGIPEITCANSTDTSPVIVFMKANKTGVAKENSCIVASYADSYEITALRDLLVYNSLGVLP